MKKSAALFSVFFVMACSASALPLDPFDMIVPARKVSKFHPRLPIGSECERILIEAETKLKRELTRAEISQALVRVLIRTNESLLHKNWTGNGLHDASEFDETVSVYFPGDAMIYTKAGFVRVKDLGSRNDEIMVYDKFRGSFESGGAAHINYLEDVFEYAEIEFEDKKLRTSIAAKLSGPGALVELLQIEQLNREQKSSSAIGIHINMADGRLDYMRHVPLHNLSKSGAVHGAYSITFNRPQIILIDGLLVQSE